MGGYRQAVDPWKAVVSECTQSQRPQMTMSGWRLVAHAPLPLPSWCVSRSIVSTWPKRPFQHLCGNGLEAQMWVMQDQGQRASNHPHPHHQTLPTHESLVITRGTHREAWNGPPCVITKLLKVKFNNIFLFLSLFNRKYDAGMLIAWDNSAHRQPQSTKQNKLRGDTRMVFSWRLQEALYFFL